MDDDDDDDFFDEEAPSEFCENCGIELGIEDGEFMCDQCEAYFEQ
jgi:hypothetical protein